MDASYPAQSLNPPEVPETDPGLDDLCAACKDELRERGEDYCSQKCAYEAGKLAERQFCLDVADQYTDTEDGPNGEPRPNAAMRIMSEIEGWPHGR